MSQKRDIFTSKLKRSLIMIILDPALGWNSMDRLLRATGAAAFPIRSREELVKSCLLFLRGLIQILTTRIR